MQTSEHYINKYPLNVCKTLKNFIGKILYTFPLYSIIIYQDTLARIQFHCLSSRYFLLFKQVLQIILVCILSGNCKTTLLTYVGRRMGHIFCKDSLLPSDYLMKQFYAQRISKLHVCQIDSCVQMKRSRTLFWSACVVCQL